MATANAVSANIASETPLRPPPWVTEQPPVSAGPSVGGGVTQLPDIASQTNPPAQSPVLVHDVTHPSFLQTNGEQEVGLPSGSTTDAPSIEHVFLATTHAPYLH